MTESHRDEIAKLEALFSANPDGRIFTHLAEAYRKVGELERARATVEQGLRRYADYASAHVVHGRVLNDLGDVAGAERAFRRVLELDPQNRVALRALGDIARRDGRAEEALEHYRNLLLLDPTNAEVEEMVKAVEEDVLAARPEVDDGGWSEVVLEDEPFGAADASEFEATGSLVEPGELVDAAFEPMDLGAEPMLEAVAGYDGAWDVSSFEGDVVEGVEPEGVQYDEIDLASFDLVASEVAAASVTADLLALDRERRESLESTDDFGGDVDGPVARALGGLLGEDVGELDFDTEDGPVVLTETMAELYAQQGLPEQAAAVYRELLRERPDDERLRARLEALEGPVEYPVDEAVFDLPTLEPHESDGGEPLEEGYGFLGEAGEPGVVDTAGLPAGEADVELILKPADIYEGDLGGGDDADESWSSEELLLSDRDIVEDELPAGEELEPDALVLTEADIVAEAEPVVAVEPVAGLAAPGEAIEPYAAAPDEREPAVAPAPAATGRSIGAYLRELVNFRVGDGPVDEAYVGVGVEAELLLDESDVAAPAEVDEFDLLFAGGATEEAADPEPEVPPSAAPAAVEDEEDLEMFRAWLQNLKR